MTTTQRFVSFVVPEVKPHDVKLETEVRGRTNSFYDELGAGNGFLARLHCSPLAGPPRSAGCCHAEGRLEPASGEQGDEEVSWSIGLASGVVAWREGGIEVQARGARRLPSLSKRDLQAAAYRLTSASG